MKHLPALDGLRAVSILLVILSHVLLLLGIQHVPGRLGVTIFFFISGFIITRMLLSEYAFTGVIKLAPFYIKRIFRLTPGVLAYVAISIAAMIILQHKILPLSDVTAVLGYYANYHQFADVQSGVLSPFAITWSLAVEEHFYLLFPALLVALRHRLQILLWLLIGVVAAIAVWRVYLVYDVGMGNLSYLRVYKGTDTRLDSLAYGCMLSVIRLRKADVLSRVAPYGVTVGCVMLLGTLLVRNDEFRESWLYSLQGIALMFLFIGLFWQPSRVRTLLEARWLTYIGRISYSLYLYHYLALVVSQLTQRNPAEQAATALILTAVGALFSYYVVETPARRFGSTVAGHIAARESYERVAGCKP